MERLFATNGGELGCVLPVCALARVQGTAGEADEDGDLT